MKKMRRSIKSIKHKAYDVFSATFDRKGLKAQLNNRST